MEAFVHPSALASRRNGAGHQGASAIMVSATPAGRTPDGASTAPPPDWLHYTPRPGCRDEAFAPDGSVRAPWRAFLERLGALGPDEMTRRADRTRRLIRDNGVTYTATWDPAGLDRPWPLDPVPLILDEPDWIEIERAAIQRAHLLNAILADLYGPRHLLAEGALPPALIHGNPAFLRPLVGARPHDGRFVHVLALDLARAPDGRWWVVDHRGEVPSGIGYALENRVIVNRVLPEILRDMPVHRLASHLRLMREGLIARAPRTRENPRVVLWTPGALNETYFEHIYLARYLGFTLVEGEDLTVRDGRVYLKTLEGLQPVDVILRRNESSFCDPLELRSDSALGAPGLVEAAHGGTVALANALGSGLIEAPALMAFLPGLCRRLLGSDLLMPSVATWWCGQPHERDHAVSALDRLALRPSYNAAAPLLHGADLTPDERETLRADIMARPHAWTAQETVTPSTTPVWRDGRLVPRALVLRVHVVADGGDGYAVIPGGLARVAGTADRHAVSMESGAGGKDTWVLSEHPIGLPARGRSEDRAVRVVRGARDLPSRVADDLFWLGRYVERCDGTTRLLRAMVGRLTEAGAGSPELGVLLDMLWRLGHPPFTQPAGSGAASQDATVRAILAANMEPLNPGGLAALALNVHRIGLRVRDRLSVDTWRAIDALIEALGLGAHAHAFPLPPGDRAARVPTRHGPMTPEDAAGRLSRTLMPLQVMAGLASENMTRGLGWRFLDTGRRIDRALLMLDIFQGIVLTTGETRTAALDAALELGDSAMTYRARYLDAPRFVPAMDVLLADESNPRSLAYQLARLSSHMDSLAPDQAFGLRTREQRLAMRLLGITRTVDLESMRLDDQHGEPGSNPAGIESRASGGDFNDAGAGIMPPPADISNLLRLLRDLLNALSDSLARQYFAHAVETRQASPPRGPATGMDGGGGADAIPDRDYPRDRP